MKYQKVTSSPRAVVSKGPSPFKPRTLSQFPDKIPGLRVKKSERWAPDMPLVIEDSPLPLIDRVGKFTGVTRLRVPCTVPQYIATTVATVASRLETHLIKHQGHRVAVKHRWLSARIAYYYSVTKNEWFIDRFLAVSRSSSWEKGKKAIFFVLRKFVAKLDAYNRFVYGQVCLQTHWLLTRGLKSVPRDKSFLLESRFKKSREVGDLSEFQVPGNVDMRRLAFRFVFEDISGLESRLFKVRPLPFPSMMGPRRPNSV
jgi:hypothetical protein